jgi:hypothetical protein
VFEVIAEPNRRAILSRLVSSQQLRAQPLPAGELHGIGAGHAADGSSAEKAIQNIESNVFGRFNTELFGIHES